MLDPALLVIWKPLLVLEERVLRHERGPGFQRDCETTLNLRMSPLSQLPHSTMSPPPALIPQLPVEAPLREWAMGR